MLGTCCAYGEDGRVCRAPATVIDHQRGGCVCDAHAPANQPKPALRHCVRLPDGQVVPYAK